MHARAGEDLFHDEADPSVAEKRFLRMTQTGDCFVAKERLLAMTD
jgi:hypothetical protein